MKKKIFGIFAVILILHLFTFNIYAMEHMMYRDNNEYSEIMSQKMQY